MSRHHPPNSKIILLLFSLLFVILLLGTWVSSVLVQERQDLRNQASVVEVVGLSCNQACSAHADCQVGLICFDAKCRLSTNPTDIYCQGVPDQGIHRSCNQYCADHNECDKGLVCYYNACRNPYNVTNESCSLPTPVPTQRSTVTKIPSPIPTATLAPKGGVFSTTPSSLTPIPTDTPIVQQMTITPLTTERLVNEPLGSDAPFVASEEPSDTQSLLEIATTIPSYLVYGIGTLIVFFISLIIYIVHTWKTPKIVLREKQHTSTQPKTYDMNSFAGNMDAHIKKEE